MRTAPASSGIHFKPASSDAYFSAEAPRVLREHADVATDADTGQKTVEAGFNLEPVNTVPDTDAYEYSLSAWSAIKGGSDVVSFRLNIDLGEQVTPDGLDTHGPILAFLQWLRNNEDSTHNGGSDLTGTDANNIATFRKPGTTQLLRYHIAVSGGNLALELDAFSQAAYSGTSHIRLMNYTFERHSTSTVDIDADDINALIDGTVVTLGSDDSNEEVQENHLGGEAKLVKGSGLVGTLQSITFTEKGPVLKHGSQRAPFINGGGFWVPHTDLGIVNGQHLLPEAYHQNFILFDGITSNQVLRVQDLGDLVDYEHNVITKTVHNHASSTANVLIRGWANADRLHLQPGEEVDIQVFRRPDGEGEIILADVPLRKFKLSGPGQGMENYPEFHDGTSPGTNNGSNCGQL